MRYKTIAIIGGIGLGDNLIQMVLAGNAQKTGSAVTMYSSIMRQISRWFPHIQIESTLEPHQYNQTLAPFSKILCPHGPRCSINSNIAEKWISYETVYRKNRHWADNIVTAGSHFLELHNGSRENRIRIPTRLHYRCNARRVAIHPTSAFEKKNWEPIKYLELAKRLENRTYEPVFIMSRQEKLVWERIVNGRFALKGFSTLDHCASFLYESAYFIGNDSGCGHLASNLGIPTLSIHGRSGNSRRWRPAWGTVLVVTPAINLIGNRLRYRFWRSFMGVDRVEQAFDKLVHISNR